jgi:hypothetical protein
MRLRTGLVVGASAICFMLAACQSPASTPESNTPNPTPAVNSPTDNAGKSNPIVGDANSTRPEDRAGPPTGAISAWDAVVWRHKYLSRRNEQVPVVGVVGDPFMQPAAPPLAVPIEGTTDSTPPSPPATTENLTWFIDDSIGHGSLGIRVKFASPMPRKGQRMAVLGAWTVDANRQWYWAATSQVELTAAPPSDIKEPLGAPGFVIATEPAPSGTQPISLAKDNDLVRFTIVEVPFNAGDGWKVADELGDPAVAILFLPGDQASYGSLDMRTAAERWKVKRGVSYWLRIGRIRRPNPNGIWLANARTAPVRDN